MNNNNFVLEKTTADYRYSIDCINNLEYKSVDDSFLFAIQKNNQLNVISGDLNPLTENIFEKLVELNEKEALYISAIENLLKQKEYLNLFYQASQNLISNEEFNEELDKNESKYLIKIQDKINLSHFKLIQDIINKLKFELSEDDLSEIFAVNHNAIFNLLENKKRNENSLR
jgi:hypothetical protein